VAAQIIFMALLGAVLGSFISVVAHRLPLGESIVKPRSRCPACGTQIAAYDNIPVLSYLALRGRCRHCSARVPVTYPLLELAMAAAFVGVLLRFPDDLAEIALGASFVTTLAAVTVTDLEHRIIPNKILLFSGLVGVVIVVAGLPDSIAERAIAAGSAFGLLFAVALAYPRGMGMGDVKLAAVMGLYLGRAVAPALIIGFAAGALVGVGLIMRHGAEARKRAVPFGPFLALGGLIALFAGDEMVDWYVESFFEG